MVDRDEAIGRLLREVSQNRLEFHRLHSQVNTAAKLASIFAVSVLSLGAYVVKTTITNESAIGEVTREVSNLRTADATRTEALTEIGGQLRALNATVAERRDANLERIEDLVSRIEELERRRRRVAR